MGAVVGQRLKVIVVGESWVKNITHIKGFDQFHTTEYEEGAGIFLESLIDSGMDVTYVRAHEISSKFPKSIDEIASYDVVVISDVGSNSFLLTDDTFLRSKRSQNLLSIVADFVSNGGGLVMVGGYMSFTGIDARARYGMSPLAGVLPVKMLTHDDRIEIPEGLNVNVKVSKHPALGGTPTEWPILLGYNRLIAMPESTVLVNYGDDPMVVVGTHGGGRSVAFASDLAPHWAPPEFMNWSYYSTLWCSIISWAGSAQAQL